jgi:hypothetical protein
LREQAFVNRPQQPCGPPDPIRQGRAIEVDPLAGVDLGLPVERKVIGVFGDQDLRDRRLGRQVALDQPGRRRCLDHHILASPTGILRTAHDENSELRRDDIEPLAHVLADPVQRVLAGWAGVVVDIADHLDARQMRRQRSPVRATTDGTDGALGRRRVFALGLAVGDDLIGVFQPKQQLIFRQRLRAPTEAMALHLLDDLAQPLVLMTLGDKHRLQRAGIVGKSRCRVRHGAK